MTAELTELDPEQLAKFVAEALGEKSGKSAVAFGDTQILEALTEILPEYLDKADVTAIFARVRTALYKDLEFGSLRSLHTVVRNCRVCPNVTPNPQLPTWNRVDPDVLFVLDTPWSGSPADNQFATQLKECGFSSRRICYTSTVRCFPREARPPSGDEITNCVKRYLFSEIQQMQPKLVVACGAIPAAAILGEAISVTEARGTMYWIGPWPVLVTYSPGYAIRTDFNMANWLTDLKSAYTFTYGDTP